jgi:hypothetical protein
MLGCLAVWRKAIMDSELGGVLSALVWIFGLCLGVAALFALFRLFSIANDLKAIRGVLEKPGKDQAS